MSHRVSKSWWSSLFGRVSPKHTGTTVNSIHTQLLKPINTHLKAVLGQLIERNEDESANVVELLIGLIKYCNTLIAAYSKKETQESYDALFINLAANQIPNWQSEGIDCIKQSIHRLLKNPLAELKQDEQKDDLGDVGLLLQFGKSDTLTIRGYTRIAQGGEAVIWRGKFQLKINLQAVTLAPCDEIFKHFNYLPEGDAAKREFDYLKKVTVREADIRTPEAFGLCTFPTINHANSADQLQEYIDIPQKAIRMERMPGISVKKFIEQLQTQQDVSDVVKWFARLRLANKLLLCVKYFHCGTELDLKHNDISLENILIELAPQPGQQGKQRFKVALIDLSSEQPDSAAQWTPGYCPKWGKEKRDAFALTVVIAEILSGNRMTECHDANHTNENVIIYEGFNQGKYQIDLSVLATQGAARGKDFQKLVSCLRNLLTAQNCNDYDHLTSELKDLIGICESRVRPSQGSACLQALQQPKDVVEPFALKELVDFKNRDNFVLASP